MFKNAAGKEVVGYITPGGMLDDYMIPEEFNINTLGRSNKQKCFNGVNAAICWNNKTHTSDLINLRKYTELIFNFQFCFTFFKSRYISFTIY